MSTLLSLLREAERERDQAREEVAQLEAERSRLNSSVLRLHGVIDRLRKWIITIYPLIEPGVGSNWDTHNAARRAIRRGDLSDDERDWR